MPAPDFEPLTKIMFWVPRFNHHVTLSVEAHDVDNIRERIQNLEAQPDRAQGVVLHATMSDDVVYSVDGALKRLGYDV